MTETKTFPAMTTNAFFWTLNFFFDLLAMVAAVATIESTYRPNVYMIIAEWMIGITVFEFFFKRLMLSLLAKQSLRCDDHAVSIVVKLNKQDVVVNENTVTYDYLDTVSIRKFLFNNQVVIRNRYGKKIRFNAGTLDNAEAICKELLERKESHVKTAA